MFNRKFFKILLLFLVMLSCMPLLYSQPKDAETAMFLLEQERKFEKEMTDYLQKDILDKIFGKDKSSILYDVEFELVSQSARSETRERATDRTRKLGDIEYILPGIPKPTAVSQQEPTGQAKEEGGQQEASKISTKINVKKQNVTVIHDDSIGKEQIDLVRDILTTTLKLDAAKGDKLEFKKARFTVPVLNTKIWEDFMKPYYIVPLLAVLLVLLFMFGPLASFLKGYLRTIRERGGTEITVDSKLEGGNPAMPGGAGGMGAGGEIIGGESALSETESRKRKEQKEEEEGKYTPFSYVDSDNLRRLVYLLSKEKPEVISIVLTYLKPEFVKEILTNLPIELQSEVVMSIATARQLNEKEIMQIDTHIKQKIDYLVGGIDQLLGIINEVDIDSRNNILEYLQKEKPELYKKIRKYVFLFEDTAEMPDLALQTVIRELKIEDIARALRNAEEKIVNKFLSNMSTGAASLMKEEMEYASNLTKEQIEEERKKIIDTILKFEEEGKIFIREKTKLVIGDEIGQDELSGSATEGEAENYAEMEDSFDRYYTYAVSLFDEGRLEEAVSYFEYCLQVRPDHPETMQYLGNIYYNLGRYNEALSYYEKALEFNPEDESMKQWVEELRKTVPAAQ